ncbi:hypothetical protein A5745_18650 [Mycobacterium sp. IS-2888]|uniref:DUF4383 domain-containing protein n=1 Tax=Mycobacterium sp. IS-2888 TaxID=1834159 RepID=UPI00096D3049|nr:DUF4383 domain-containing protein [Mycobacterium sp. IS-2888]OMC54958.1 hypothetical protein A5745_18650 [Mycobacterium sp. IS-2888]
MPVTAGHVPGLTSGLRRVRTDPKRFRNGRWFLLAEGVLVSAFGIAGLVSAALHPHAGPTGVPVLGLATAPAHSAILLAFGLVAIAAVSHRRAAVAVTALSAVAYMVLLFFSAVATSRDMPTAVGFHAADVALHGVLAVVNLGLLMWLIPDELGDEAWVRRRGRRRDPRQPPTPAVPARESGAPDNPSPPDSSDPPGSTPPVDVHTARRSTPEPPGTARAPEAVRLRATVVPVALAVLAAGVLIVVWIRHH